MRRNSMSFHQSLTVRQGFLALFVAALAVQGCTRSKSHDDAPNATQNQNNDQSRSIEKPGITVPSGNLPRPSSDDGSIAYLGGIISTRVIAGQTYIPVEGTFSDNSFSTVMSASVAQQFSDVQRSAFISREISGVLKAIGTEMRVLHTKIIPEVGFFSALIPLEGYERLSSVKGLSHHVLINPVLSMIRSPETLGLKPATGISLGLHADIDGRGDTDSFSGLGRIGVDEFLAKVQADIGQEADGSNVNIGVSDTGLTLNHPAFFDAAGHSRVHYLKDFTNEGLIYFPSTAQFSVTVPTSVPAGVDINEALLVTAQYILPPSGTQLPVGDRFSDLTNQLFTFSPELKAALLTPNSGARLGVFSEAALNNVEDKEFVDLNQNGKTDDLLWAILLPDANPALSRVYLDVTGLGNFTRSVALQDWTTTKSTIKVGSETAGFEIKSMPLEDSAGNQVDSIVAAIVGYDPGNHGSHVSGIIAGRKTLSNDPDQTKARGVAPNGKLMLGRVCANNGGCSATNAIIDLSLNGAEVINMSLGGLGPMNDGYGVQETVINRLTLLRNTLFVISAGNSGPGRQTVGSPSVARLSLSVAATASKKLISRQYQWPASGKNPFAAPTPAGADDEDFVLFFSSRGPTAAGGMKPNIAAPGTELSSIQLNAAPGARPGLDVYWGTSMAAPTATGAVALLIDAAKRYNALHPDHALSLDARTLHKVITASARPFDVDSYNVTTQARTHGQYSWIDEGHGMINLSAAWDALKAERDTKLPTAVVIESAAGRQPVDLDYEIRVLRKNPNGLDFTGSVDAPTDTQGGLEPKFGRGIYLDTNSTESLIEVQLARRLPLSLLRRPDLGDLNRLLNTSADQFAIETTIYGSAVEWLKAGSLEQLDCHSSPVGNLTVIGPGAVDNFSAAPDSGNRSVGLRASNLQVCVNRELVSTLAPGDHGALIKAYRIAEGRRESAPSFVIPVYLAVTHGTLAGQAGYSISGSAPSFSVNRNYVQIPEGTSMVKVSVEVPATSHTAGTPGEGCAGVELMILEGVNNGIPAEIKDRTKARATNCEKNGLASVAAKRVVSYSRLNPKPGIWDIHVFGQYAFKNSPYTLHVEFAKVATSVASITGRSAALTGNLVFEVLESSLAVAPSAQTSVYSLNSLIQDLHPQIAQHQNLIVADAAGVQARSYDATVASVNISTGGAAGSDLDLVVLECTDAADIPGSCIIAGQSGGATDVESVDFSPLPGLFYAAQVVGYDVLGGVSTAFAFTEKRKLASRETGTLTIVPDSSNANLFRVDFGFDVAASSILQSSLFSSGNYSAGGDLVIKGQDGASLVRLPVKVSAQ